MGRKKKKSGGVSANHAESDESRETPAEEGTGEAPEAIEYDTSKLILDEFHESVEELPSHVDERERSATVSTLGSEMDGERCSVDTQQPTGIRRDPTGLHAGIGNDPPPGGLAQDAPVFFDAQSEPAIGLGVGPGDGGGFIIECNDHDDDAGPHGEGGAGKHVSFKENLISEDITAASDPMVYDLGERRVSFAEDDTTADIDGNYYSLDPTAPLITRELIGGEEDEGEKMVNSFIASASATETIMEEDRVTWKAPLVQTIMKGLSARCCCSKQVRFQDDY